MDRDDAATWLPPNRGFRCAMVARQVAVKARYDLWVTQAEKGAIVRVLASCPNELLPTAAAPAGVVPDGAPPAAGLATAAGSGTTGTVSWSSPPAPKPTRPAPQRWAAASPATAPPSTATATASPASSPPPALAGFRAIGSFVSDPFGMVRRARTSWAVPDEETPMITQDDLRWWLETEPRLDWQFATTYADGAPHEYVVADKTPGLAQADVARAAHVIRTFGEPMKFYRTTRIYLTTPMGWKHWDMQDGRITDADVTLINRGRVEHVYGAQNAPPHPLGCRVLLRRARDHLGRPARHDRAGEDPDHGPHPGRLRKQAGAYARRRLRHRLAVGRGFGRPGALRRHRPVHRHAQRPGRQAPPPRRRAPDDLRSGGRAEGAVRHQVRHRLALGGSASYLSPEDVAAMRRAAKGPLLLMHHGPDSSTTPADLDAVVDAASLDAAAQLATSRTQVGRYVATVIA